MNSNAIVKLEPLEGLTELYYLFLEGNKIEDLTPLVTMAKKDFEGPKRFAPFINIYLKGNPLDRGSQRPARQVERVRLPRSLLTGIERSLTDREGKMMLGKMMEAG